MVQVSSTSPLYIQIAEGLLERIDAAELVPGHRLPPERQLSETLGVTRTTLRQALRLLESQGLLIRKQGAGTFVAHPKIERQTNQLAPFSHGVQKQGYQPETKVILIEQQPAKKAAANFLKLPVSAPIYAISRLHLVDQEPAMLEKLMLSIQRFPNLESCDLAQGSLYEILETEYGAKVTQTRQGFEAVSATEYEAKLLGIYSGAPLMLAERITFDQGGHPVEYAQDLYRGDRFRFVTEQDFK